MRKILVTEDNLMNREILKDILCDDYEVLEAENGQEALAILNEQYQDISVMLLDLHMPVMDGFALLKILHTDPLLSTVPVIVMTADENADTEERCMDLGAVEFLEKPYNPVVVLGRVRNMVRMLEAAREIESIEYDGATGLFTRQAFYHYTARRLAEHPDTAYTVLATDIREFKLINSAYGEGTAARVLKAMADHLNHDAADRDGIAGFYGEAQFVALFPSDIIPAWEGVEQDLEHGLSIAPVSYLNVQIGVYENVDHAMSPEAIVERAMTALDVVKESVTRHIGLYDEELAARQREEQLMEARFDGALGAGEFVPFFQPKVDPVNGQLVGAEALVRWQRSDGSFVPPYRFIPLFERDGLVARLDREMFRMVSRAQAAWRAAGKRVVPISVNLSRNTLLRPDTVDTYRTMVTEAGIPPRLVPLEVTESAAFLTGQIGGRMQELQEAGFPLDMDDFGSGYSSLSALSELPFSVAKIDKSLTDHVTAPRGGMLVRHLMEVIHALGMQVVAECAETADQVQALREMGCDAIQGYFYSKPVPKDVFEEMLDKGYLG